jgi:hypothetical protein
VILDPVNCRGVLVFPCIMDAIIWEERAAANQAKYHERDSETDPSAAGAERLRANALRRFLRTSTETAEGLTIERTQPGDLPR